MTVHSTRSKPAADPVEEDIPARSSAVFTSAVWIDEKPASLEEANQTMGGTMETEGKPEAAAETFLTDVDADTPKSVIHKMSNLLTYVLSNIEWASQTLPRIRKEEVTFEQEEFELALRDAFEGAMSVRTLIQRLHHILPDTRESLSIPPPLPKPPLP